MSFRFTVAELAFLIPTGTILGAIAGAVASYQGAKKAAEHTAKAQLNTTEATISAQREVTERTLETQRKIAADERAANDAREQRAHKRDAYLEIITTANEITDDMTLFGYMQVAPRLDDPENIDPWMEWRRRKYDLISRIHTNAVAYGSDHLLTLTRDLNVETSVLFELLDEDQQQQVDHHNDTSTPSNNNPRKRAISRTLASTFSQKAEMIWGACQDIKQQVRDELGLSDRKTHNHE